jgi:hypothetical protein
MPPLAIIKIIVRGLSASYKVLLTEEGLSPDWVSYGRPIAARRIGEECHFRTHFASITASSSEGGHLNAVADREFVALGKFLPHSGAASASFGSFGLNAPSSSSINRRGIIIATINPNHALISHQLYSIHS